MQSQRNCGDFNSENQSVNTDSATNTGQSDFHGASFINDEGMEIPITESMVQDAFETLIDAWERQHLAGNLPSKIQLIQPIPN